MPVGFISNELRSERELGRRADEPVRLPSGFVTMLLTDIEGSTALVHRLGDSYGDLLDRVRALLRDSAVGTGGHVVETRADEFFAVFERPAAALATALAVQRELRARGRRPARRMCASGSGSTVATRRWPGRTISAWPCTSPHGSAMRRTGGRSWCRATSAPNSWPPAGRCALEEARDVPSPGPARRRRAVPGRGPRGSWAASPR